MKTTMLLLVSTVALLAGPAIAKPHVNPHHDTVSHVNLDRILDLAGNYTASLPKGVKESYVEDVAPLVSGPNKCKPQLFCKIEEILTKHDHFGGEEEIVRTLVIHNEGHKAICDQVRQKQEGEGDKIQLLALLTHLVSCIKFRNFNG